MQVLNDELVDVFFANLTTQHQKSLIVLLHSELDEDIVCLLDNFSNLRGVTFCLGKLIQKSFCLLYAETLNQKFVVFLCE